MFILLTIHKAFHLCFLLNLETCTRLCNFDLEIFGLQFQKDINFFDTQTETREKIGQELEYAKHSLTPDNCTSQAHVLPLRFLLYT